VLNTGKTPTLNPGSLASPDTSATAKGWPVTRKMPGSQKLLARKRFC